MNLDDEICYCYHVTLRKLVNFARRERPQHGSQMSECLGAGTGCGWCRQYLRSIASEPDNVEGLHLPATPEEYAAARETYRAEKRAEK